MPLTLSGTNGVSGVDGSASTPANRGSDTNTGIVYGTDTVQIATGGTTAVTVDSSQNVGIGTATLNSSRLVVKQSADTGAASFSFAVEANANDTRLAFGYRGTGAASAADTCAITASYGSTGAFKPLTFLTSDTERARITSGGLFNINIPTGTPVQRLNLYDAGNSNQMLIYGLNQGSIQFGTYNAGSATGGFILGRSISTNNANDFFLFDAVATATRWQVDTSGNFHPGADNAYTCGKSGFRWSAIWAANGTIQTSDIKAKTDIIPSPLGLSFINQLNPVAYKFKVGGNIPVKHDGEDTTTIVEPIPGKRQHFGLIAQEVKAVLPATVDFGGWVQTDLSDADSEQGLRYEEFISPMIKAIQELSAKLDAAEARIAALEAK